MSEEREEVYQILELGKDLKNLHHKKGFGGLLFIDLSMIKFSKLSSYIRQLDKENEELKKQLEEYKKWYQDELEENSKLSELWCDSRAKIRKFENQQKEFIKWLEDYLKLFDYRDIQEQAGYDMLEEILQKYKEIIGEK